MNLQKEREAVFKITVFDFQCLAMGMLGRRLKDSEIEEIKKDFVPKNFVLDMKDYINEKYGEENE